MTTQVALQATKRRKMGFDVDFFNDSGVPMDGIELDSSSSSNTPTASQGGVSGGSSSRGPVNLLANNSNDVLTTTTGGNNNELVTNSQNTSSSLLTAAASLDSIDRTHSSSLAGTTNSTTSSSQAMPPISSTPDKQQHQKQRKLQDQERSNDVGSDCNQAVSSNDESPSMNMTNNEAMTNDEPSMVAFVNDVEDNILKFSNQNSPDYSQSTNFYPMNEDSCLDQEERRQQPQQQSSTNGSSQINYATNEVRKVRERASQVRSFGDLFDDDDLD